MPIYLSPRTSAATQAHPSFKARNVFSNTAGPLKDLYVTGVAIAPQVAYSGYSANISAFIAATNRGERLVTQAPGLALLGANRPLIPLPLPSIAFVSRLDLTSDQIEQFIQKLEVYAPISTKAGRVAKVTLRKPDFAIAEKLVPRCLDFVRCENNEVHPSDLRHYHTLLIIITEFLATNTYPAWVTKNPEDDTRDPTEHMVNSTILTGFVHPTSKDYQAMAAAVAKVVTDADEMKKEEVKKVLEQYKFNNWDSGIVRADPSVVMTAKPSPLPYTFNCGGISQVPGNLPGILFPYFPGMNIPDKVSMRKLVFSRFFRNFGSTLAQCQSTWVLTRAAIDRICSTPNGQVLSHIFYGIDLALQTQTRMFVIIEYGEYNGFVLFGERFVIYDGKDFHAPEEPSVLHSQVLALDNHTQALKTISHVLSSAAMRTPHPDTDNRVPVSEADLSTPMKLVKAIVARSLTRQERDTLADPIFQLRYHQTFLQNTPQNLLWALEMMTGKAREILPDDTPCFIPGNLDLLEDRLFLVLAAYGPDAPSLYTHNGRDSFHLARPTLREGYMQLPLSTATPPKLHVALKGVTAAYQDWKKVLKDKEICMDFRERAGKNRCMIVNNREQVDDVFFALCSLAYQGAGPRTDKRKADDSGMDLEGREAKRAMIENLDEFMDL